jgi:hypothetical protein
MGLRGRDIGVTNCFAEKLLGINNFESIKERKAQDAIRENVATKGRISIE